eukprot:5029132-Amphidinium_carterae.2
MGQESTNAVQWMREMESATDALDFDLYVDEKKREAVSLYFRLQVGNQDGFEAYRRLAIRYAPRTLDRNLTRLTSIIDHDFGSDEMQMLGKIASWERQIEYLRADQQGTTMVQLDYSFLTNGESQVPLLAAIDNVYHGTMAVLVPLKGAEEYAVKSIRIFIQSLGIPNGVIQSDSEHSALAGLERYGRETALGIARHVPDHQVMPRRTVQDEDTNTSSKFAVVISTRSMVERPVPDRSEGSEDGIPTSLPEAISKDTSPIR